MQELRSLDLGNNVLRFDVIEGVIAGDKKWAETHVYSTGGGGYVGPQGGYVQLPTVQSNVSTRHEIWIKEHGSEREFPISLTDTNVKIREGHEVAIVVADTGQHRYFAQLVNRTSQQTFSLLGNFRSFVLEAANFHPAGFFGAAFFALVLAMVLNLAANIAYTSPQKAIQEKNMRAQAEAIHVPYDKYKNLYSGDQDGLRADFVLGHQAKLLGISMEQRKKLGGSGSWKLLDKKVQEQFGVSIPFDYFMSTPERRNPKLTAEQENAVHQLLYGSPQIEHGSYDERYSKHGSQIGNMVGGILGILGVLWAAYRANKSNRRLREVEAKVQAHFAQLANALK